LSGRKPSGNIGFRVICRAEDAVNTGMSDEDSVSVWR